MASYYTCCGDPVDGSSGTGCDHRGGRVVTARRWRQLSHGAVGPWRAGWRDRGAMCASGCDCRDDALREAARGEAWPTSAT